MRRFLAAAASLFVVALLVIVAVHHPAPIAKADAMMGSAAMTSPVSGFNLHIDASQHYAGHPSEIIHHWCKSFSPTFIECLLFDADGPNGHEVGVETIVPTAVWKTYPASERAYWHDHRVEIPKLKYAKLPGLTPAQANKVIASLMTTHGKVWILWDPETTNGKPIGEPTITILH
jgi:hypothetical protein